MIKKLLSVGAFILFFTYSFTQESASIVGDWQLKSIDLKDLTQTKELNKEESFFAYYLDPQQTLHISDSYFSVVVGGDQLNYTYELTKYHVLLKYTNKIMILTESKDVITKEMEGNTRLNYKLLDENTLEISLNNETFTEKYIFVRNF